MKKKSLVRDKDIKRTIVDNTYETPGGDWSGNGTAWLQFLSTPYWLRQDQEELKDPFTQHAWVYAAVMSLAHPFSSLPLLEMTGDRDDRRSQKIVDEETQMGRLFEQPNPETCWRVFACLHLIYKKVCGAALWLSTKNGEPARIQDANAIYFLNPRVYRPKRDKQRRIIQWVDPSNQLKPYNAEFVHWFRYPNPWDPDCGLSPLTPAAISIKTDHIFEMANRAFAENGFQLGGWLLGEELSADQAEKLEKKLSDRFAGKKGTGGFPILSGAKMTVVPNTASQRSMQFVEYAQWTRSKILACIGTCESWVALGSKMNYATADAESDGCWLRSIDPELKEIEDYLWSVWSRPAGGERWMQFDRSGVPAFRRAFISSKLEDAKALQNLGYTANQVNRALDLPLPDQAWGDEAYMNGAMLPISYIKDQEERDKEKQKLLADQAEAKKTAAEKAQIPNIGQNGAPPSNGISAMPRQPRPSEPARAVSKEAEKLATQISAEWLKIRKAALRSLKPDAPFQRWEIGSLGNRIASYMKSSGHEEVAAEAKERLDRTERMVSALIERSLSRLVDPSDREQALRSAFNWLSGPRALAIARFELGERP